MNEKTYRAIRHDVVRNKQKINAPDVQHTEAKRQQLKDWLSIGAEVWGDKVPKILELFAGQGTLTEIYKFFGVVDAYDRKWLKTGDSYRVFHRLIADRKIYDVIDIDPYGFPNRFFPDICLLIEDDFMVVTMPKPFVNILNGITQAHLISYYGEHNPSLDSIINRLALWGICHWRQVEVLNVVDFGRLWRFFLRVKKVKATEYTGVRNR